MTQPEPLTIVESIEHDGLLLGNCWWPGRIWIANDLLSKAYVGQLRDTTYRDDILEFRFLNGTATYKEIRDRRLRTYEDWVRDRTAFEFVRGNRDVTDG